MPSIQVSDDISLFYERIGTPGDPVILLIHGLGAQLIAWDDEFCELLASRGFEVIRFDNRDIGLSTHTQASKSAKAASWLSGRVSPSLVRKAPAAVLPKAGYLLSDMADDAIGLLRVLQISKAHVVGISMGGMIAQLVAARGPEMVMSLTSISSNLNPDDTHPTEDATRVLLRPPGTDREGFIADTVDANRVVSSPGFPFDEDRERIRAAAAYDRRTQSSGVQRQLLAIMSSGNRTEVVSTISAPTLVIHGADDPLIPASNGEATAKAIQGAELMILEGMGHDLPRQVWPQLVAAIVANAARATAS